MTTTGRPARPPRPNETADATRRRGLTEEEFLAKVEAGVFYDRFDELMPLDLYGPPTSDELAAAARQRDNAAGVAPAVPSVGRSGPNGRTRRAPDRKRH